jgi:hypothetical protein
MGWIPLDLTNNPVDARTRITIKQDVDIIRHHFPFYDVILWTEDDMVLTTLPNAVICMVRFGRLTQLQRTLLIDSCTQYITEHWFLQQLKRLKRRKPVYPRAKAPGLYGLFL